MQNICSLTYLPSLYIHQRSCCLSPLSIFWCGWYVFLLIFFTSALFDCQMIGVKIFSPSLWGILGFLTGDISIYSFQMLVLFFFPGMWDPKYYSRSPGIFSARLSSSVFGSVVYLGWGASTRALPGADIWEYSISGTKLGFLSMKDMDSWPLCPPVLSFSSIFWFQIIYSACHT